ncbi:diguanylate cyclase [Marinobacter bryozoorum]|uniref:diguanylate cyclase n=1 Tax=Marinobacter bryozoorum TaxID=256324 RepID=UPI00200546FC|nr:diguanylate cyclase [Marinobacter bryozoorum]MCK7545664.1 diguanylate cyclase [Marinobacter bryozoorum]
MRITDGSGYVGDASVISDLNNIGLLTAALDTVSEAVLVAEPYPQLSIVYANAAFYSLTGYAAAEVIGRRLTILQGSGTPGNWLDIFSGGSPVPVEITNYRKDGTPFQSQWTIRAWPSEGDTEYLVAVQQDVTHLRALEHQHMQLELLTRMQELVSTAGLDLAILRRKVAEVMLEATGAEAAAVEEAEGDEMVYTATSGKARAVEGLRLPIDASLSGTCYREQKPIFCPDVYQDQRVDHKAASAAGFRSGLLVPLLHQGHCFGALKAYSNRPRAFRRDQLELLEMASQVLAASLHDARRFKREQDQRTLLVDALPILISFIDKEYRYREINAAYSRWFNIEPDEIIGRTVADVVGQKAFGDIRQYMITAMAGERVRFEMTVPYSRGGPRPVEADYIPVKDSDGAVMGFYALVRDLTELRTAERDHLTQAYNRRGFDRRLKTSFATARRYQRPLSLLFLDIDRFKPVNDQCGHDVGDKILRRVVRLLMWHARESDIVCRWGGEEFAILAPETNLVDAMELAERLRQTVAAEVASPLGPITISIGVVELLAEESRKQFLRRADRALYQAKEKGRDRVETFSGA